MSIYFEELAGSPVVRVGERETVALRTFRVGWDDWPAFARELTGSYVRVGCSFVFRPPLEFPGLPNLVVSEIEVAPFVPDGPRGELVETLTSGTNRYPEGGAQVTATYRTAFDARNSVRGDLPSVPAGTFLTYTAELGAELQRVPGRVWHWVASGNPIVPPDVSPGVLIPTGSFRLTWQRVPAPPWGAMRDARGKVNNATFLSAPAGSVVFLGATARHQFPLSEAGSFWTIEYAFAERTVPLSTGFGGWNHFYKEQPASGEHWVEIADDSGNRPYRSGDFSALFVFGSC